MGLKEMAVAVYKKEKEREREENIQNAEKFVVRAKDVLIEKIGDKFTIQVIAKESSKAIFDVDGIAFKVDQYGVYIIKKCPKCVTEYCEELPTFGNREIFQDIGMILSNPHNDYDCKRALEDKEGKKLTTDEKLLQVLKDFVQEHTGEYAE